MSEVFNYSTEPQAINAVEDPYYGTPQKIFQGKYHQDGWGGDDYECTSKHGAMLIEHIKYVLDHVTLPDGLYLEFGIHEGRTATRIADYIHPRILHGFDVFTGLPEAWFCVPKGGFATEVPTFKQENIKVHVGLFEETLPRFVNTLPITAGPVAFLHADADLYSSTKTIFKFLRDRIIPGTVILFDEYNGYPGWEQHEYKAFKEFLQETGYKAFPLSAFQHNSASPASFIIK